MTNQAVIKQESSSAVAPWAKRTEVRELAERLKVTKAMMPGSERLSDGEAIALAQAAIAHGLDPFNGEVWLIKGRDGKPMGLMAGIKGLRRAAHIQMEREGGGNYWPEFIMMTPDEMAALGIPGTSLAYRCLLRDTRTLNHYISQIERLLKMGLPWEAVEKIVGERPYTEGIGYAMPSEVSKMTLIARAMKRAEAEALKRRFDLPFGTAVGENGDSDDDLVVNGEFVVSDDEQDTQPSADEKLKRGREILHGDGDSEEIRPEDVPETILARLHWDEKYSAFKTKIVDSNALPGFIQYLANRLQSIGYDQDGRKHLLEELFPGVKFPYEYTAGMLQTLHDWTAFIEQNGREAYDNAVVILNECMQQKLPWSSIAKE